MLPDGTVVLTGAHGILGSAFACVLPADRLVSLGRHDLEPVDPAAVLRHVVQLKPSLLINCAADTDVEGAETAPERAFATNATLAGALARAAAESGARMLHFGSTGCYGDWKRTPYEEDDTLRPTTVHHSSKAAGEALVLRASNTSLVMRLGWVFGGRSEQRKNFVWARLMEARSKPEIGCNPVQIGCPTYADDVVRQALVLLHAQVAGIVNCVGGGAPASRLDYVAAILAAGGSDTQVSPAVFARRAPVSPNEAASNARLRCLDLDRMPPWPASLAAYVGSLMNATAAD